MTPKSRILGGLYGSLVGDALGVPVEFKPRAERVLDPVIDMRDYGTHGQPHGTWSDDGALLLCAAESLAEQGFDTQDMGERFLRWFTHGLWTARGTLFDIGFATRKALRLIEEGCPAEIAGGEDVHSNGNGSLMRILPVPLASLRCDDDIFVDRIFRASAITHAHSRSRLACVLHGLFVRCLMKGDDSQTALKHAQSSFRKIYSGHAEFAHFSNVLGEDLSTREESTIKSSGYVIHTLTASLWCLLTTSSFSECVLKAVNLGDDTDTTGCVAGGLAGLIYGIDFIPADWLAALPRKDELRTLFDSFIQNSVHDS
ncbi:MAG: ADP-ribosylglycohydrolase family protein [Verrucomicrobiota bacterium]